MQLTLWSAKGRPFFTSSRCTSLGQSGARNSRRTRGIRASRMVGELSMLYQPGAPDKPEPILIFNSISTLCRDIGLPQRPCLNVRRRAYAMGQSAVFHVEKGLRIHSSTGHDQFGAELTAYIHSEKPVFEPALLKNRPPHKGANSLLESLAKCRNVMNGDVVETADVK